MFMAMLDEKYDLDYLVYSVSNNFTEFENLYNKELKQLILYSCFKKFDRWIQEKLLKQNAR